MRGSARSIPHDMTAIAAICCYGDLMTTSTEQTRYVGCLVSATTHRALRVAAAQDGLTVAEVLRGLISVHLGDSDHITTPKDGSR